MHKRLPESFMRPLDDQLGIAEMPDRARVEPGQLVETRTIDARAPRSTDAETLRVRAGKEANQVPSLMFPDLILVTQDSLRTSNRSHDGIEPSPNGIGRSIFA